MGRFAQADTIVPDGVQGYDRYAYTGNNPVRYVDPSGHFMCDDERGKCRNPVSILSDYGITTHGLTEDERWQAVNAATFAGAQLDSVVDYEHRYSAAGITKQLQGSISLNSDPNRIDCETKLSVINCGKAARYANAFLHEFGHALENHLYALYGRSASALDTYADAEGNPIDQKDGQWYRTALGFKCGINSWACLEHPVEDGDYTSGMAKVEQWADLYMNWALDASGDPAHGFTADPLGDARRHYIAQQFYWLLTGGYLP